MAAAELVIGGVITADPWMSGDVSAAMVRKWLGENAKAKEIVVRVNSGGGDAFEGVAVYNALKRHDARIIVDVEGLAASAASVIAMAGDEIRVHQGAMIMIHEASTFAWGNAKDLRSSADRIEKIGVEVADIYVARSGKSKDEVLKMMADETWMGGKDAVSLGFADQVIEPKKKKKHDMPEMSALSRIMLAGYRNAPGLLRAELLARPSLAQSYAIGDRVRVKTGHAHDDMTMDAEGTIQILHGGPALGIEFDGMDSVHKWYAPDEVESISDGGPKSAPKVGKPMKMNVGRSPLGELARAPARIGGPTR